MKKKPLLETFGGPTGTSPEPGHHHLTAGRKEGRCPQFWPFLQTLLSVPSRAMFNIAGRSPHQSFSSRTLYGQLPSATGCKQHCPKVS